MVKRFRCRFGSSASPNFRDLGASSPRLVVARRFRAMSSCRGFAAQPRPPALGKVASQEQPPLSRPGRHRRSSREWPLKDRARKATSRRPAPLLGGGPRTMAPRGMQPLRRRNGVASPPTRPARSCFQRGPCRRRAMVQRGPLRGSCRRRTLAQRGPSEGRVLLTAGRAPRVRRRRPVPPLPAPVASKEQPPGKARGTDTTTRPRRGPALAAKVGLMCW